MSIAHFQSFGNSLQWIADGIRNIELKIVINLAMRKSISSAHSSCQAIKEFNYRRFPILWTQKQYYIFRHLQHVLLPVFKLLN